MNSEQSDSGSSDAKENSEAEESENECTKAENAEKKKLPARRGLADVMAKIVNKKLPNVDCVILAKCKTDRQRLRDAKKKLKTESAESVTVKEEVSSDYDSDDSSSAKIKRERIVKRKRWEELGRVKPCVLDRDHEKNLQRIATKGVVQLFNAVRKQQAMLEEKLQEAGPSEGRREKAIMSITKGKFLDLLKNTKTPSRTEVKTEPVDEEQDAEQQSATWSILRDDFMMGAKMKDWDRQTNSNDIAGDDD